MALFPPPPTPTTLILAESIWVKELQIPKRRRPDRPLRRFVGKEMQLHEFFDLNSEKPMEMDVVEWRDEVSSEDGFVRPIAAINADGFSVTK